MIDDTIRDVTERPGTRRRRWTTIVSVIGVLLIAGSLGFKIFEPVQVLPRIRLAPGFIMTDQHGDQITSEDLKGSVVLYTFTYTNCGDPCLAPEPTVAEVRDRMGEVDLGGVDMRFVTVSFDPTRDTPGALAGRADEMGADGDEWIYATPSYQQAKTVIGAGFREWYEPAADDTFSFDPTLVLVDGWGVVRGEYRYQTLTSDVDRIVHHLDILGEEIRNSHGAASLAYEAAHLFLCYP